MDLWNPMDEYRLQMSTVWSFLSSDICGCVE